MTKIVKAECVDSLKFIIKTPRKTYYFKGPDEDSTHEWVSAINSTITTYCCENKYR